MALHDTRRGYLRAVGATLGGVALAGCGGGGGGGATVDMTDSLVFDPAALTVAAGETVTWENVGSAAHTVTAYGDELPDGVTYFASGGFGSEDAARNAYPKGAIEGGETYAHAFEGPGTYGYFCIPHERAGMTGTVEVTEG